MTTEWSSRSRDLRTTKLKIFTTCPCRKLYQPWLKQYHQESTFMSCLMVVVSSPSAWPLNNTGWEWLRCGFLSKKWSVVAKGRRNSFWAGQSSRCLLLRLSSVFCTPFHRSSMVMNRQSPEVYPSAWWHTAWDCPWVPRCCQAQNKINQWPLLQCNYHAREPSAALLPGLGVDRSICTLASLPLLIWREPSMHVLWNSLG